MEFYALDEVLEQISEAIEDADEGYAVDLLADHPTLDVNRPWRSEHLIVQACAGNMPELVEALIERGASTTPTNAHGRTGLDLACRDGSMAVMDVLLKHGVSPVPTDAGASRITPLHWAAQRGLVPVVTRLLDAGAPINAVCDVGLPLHLAIQANREDVVNVLLERGSALHLTNEQGQTPVQLAEALQQHAMVRALIAQEQAALRTVMDHPSAPSAAPRPRL